MFDCAQQGEMDGFPSGPIFMVYIGTSLYETLDDGDVSHEARFDQILPP